MGILFRMRIADGRSCPNLKICVGREALKLQKMTLIVWNNGSFNGSAMFSICPREDSPRKC